MSPALAARPLATITRFGLPGPLWTAVLVLVAGGVLLGLGFFLPTSSPDNHPLRIGMLVLSFSMAGAILLLRDRVPDWFIWGVQIVYVAGSSALLASSPTDVGQLSFMLAFITPGVYAGLWGSTRAVVRMLALITVGGSVALYWSGRLDEMLLAWAALVPITIGITAVIHVLVRALERQTVVDPLTGLLNRRGLAALVSARAVARTPQSVVVIDVDGFKGINDRDGHLEGDRVLRELADGWSHNVRSGDLVARTGGDEFVMVLADTAPAEANQLVTRLRSLNDHSWSYGIAAWRPGTDFDAALASADAELLRMKQRRVAR